MVAKISSTANLGGALGYNFKKVTAGEAAVILTSGLSLDAGGNTSMQRALEDMELLLPTMMRTRKPVFHASLNPHPNDNLSDGDLTRIASYYMEQLGYGSQPYIVFKHQDIERGHIHIVSLRVDADGRKINDSFERRRSKGITNDIERMWQLIPSSNKRQKTEEIDSRQKSADGDVKRRISGTLAAVLKKYSFQSLGEFNAVLNRHNIVAEEVGKENNGRRYKGIVYSVTDKNGKKQTVPIDAGELGRGFGYNALTNRMNSFKPMFAPYRNNLRKAIRMAMQKSPDRKDFIRLMENMGVAVLFRENDFGRIYGITFIDERNGVVANGSRLGKGYSANVFNDYFNGSGNNPFLNIAEPQHSLTEREARGDDLIAGVTDVVLDFSSPQGIDYKELAFQRKMRKLYSGKVKNRKL